VTAHSVNGNGLNISKSLNSSLDSVNFQLDDGGQTTFDFFKIWTNESSPTQSGNGAPGEAISAVLDFEDPDTGVTINGVTVAGRAGFLSHLPSLLVCAGHLDADDRESAGRS
jgi:hypothetical protein